MVAKCIGSADFRSSHRARICSTNARRSVTGHLVGQGDADNPLGFAYLPLDEILAGLTGIRKSPHRRREGLSVPRLEIGEFGPSLLGALHRTSNCESSHISNRSRPSSMVPSIAQLAHAPRTSISVSRRVSA